MDSSNKVIKYSLVFLILIELLLFNGIRYICLAIFKKIIDPSAPLEGYSLDILTLTILASRALYFIGYSTAYYFLVSNRCQQQLLDEMEKQELENIIKEKEIKNELILTQNAFLRAQINPDFLIKVLNHLYNETNSAAPKAAESILSLSAIMKYALSKEASSGNVLLADEIKLIETFLHLHQARQVHRAELKLSYNASCLPIKFIPLILMTLTENILKHGKLADPQPPAEIKINYENSILRIETSNHESTNSKIPSHGIGLKNIRERLFLAYGERATFNHKLDSKRYFHTSLVVHL